jgi:hypothetical protein
MPLPELGSFFEDDVGLVWVISMLTPATDAAEAKVLLVRMVGHEEEIGTMANEWTAAEWEQYRVEYGLTPCPRPPPMLRSK